VRTEGEAEIITNLKRKSDQADRMFTNLVQYMGQSLAIKASDNGHIEAKVPPWM